MKPHCCARSIPTVKFPHGECQIAIVPQPLLTSSLRALVCFVHSFLPGQCADSRAADQHHCNQARSINPSARTRAARVYISMRSRCPGGIIRQCPVPLRVHQSSCSDWLQSGLGSGKRALGESHCRPGRWPSRSLTSAGLQDGLCGQ